jgi:hypothetical protein
LQLKDWRIDAFFSCGDKDFRTACSPTSGNLPLYHIEITPEQPVSMRQVKFPRTFSIGHDGIPAIHVTCNVYEDKFGLQYWAASSDSSSSYKRGDLLISATVLAALLKRSSIGNREFCLYGRLTGNYEVPHVVSVLDLS